MSWALVPLGPPVELDLDDFAPLVREVVQWIGAHECPPTLVGLVRCAPAGVLDDAKAEVTGRMVPVPWTLNAIVRHALLPLAELSLMHDQPVIPELGAALFSVLGDPRLGSAQRLEVERALLDSEEFEAELAELAGAERRRVPAP